MAHAARVRVRAAARRLRRLAYAGNRRLHLYRLDALPAAWASIAAREPDLRAAFDLRLGGGALTWARDPCGGGLDRTPFYLEAVPADAGDLPADRAAAGFETFSFLLSERGVRFDGKCMARLELPDYPIAGVRTGQRAEGLPPVWEASLPVEDASFPRGTASWRETAAAATPALSSAFEVSLDGRTLHYVRDGCADADVEARFFLHVTPLDAADLPEERREAGFANLDFAFGDRGLRHGGLCLASVPLPEYGIARVRTGQFEGGARLWEGEIAFGE